MKRYIILLLLALCFASGATALAEGEGFDVSLLKDVRFAAAAADDGIYVCGSADGALSCILVFDAEDCRLYIAQSGLSAEGQFTAEGDIPLLELLSDLPAGRIYGISGSGQHVFRLNTDAEPMREMLAGGVLDAEELARLYALEWTAAENLVWSDAHGIIMDARGAAAHLEDALGGAEHVADPGARICKNCAGLGCVECGYNGWRHVHEAAGDCLGDAQCAACGAELTDAAYDGGRHAGDEYYGGEYCDECHPEHSGGVAACVSPAVCEVCENPYGDIDAQNHVNTALTGVAEPGCEADGYTGDMVCADCLSVLRHGEAVPATGHSFSVTATGVAAHKLVCAACGVIAEEAHAGGSADCVSFAICEVCGVEYGDTDAAIHAGKPYAGTSFCNGCHPAHSGGTANCVGAAKCNVCGWAYGSADAAKHAGVVFPGTTCCDRCHLSHTGGTATCVQGAICEICGVEYGIIDSLNHAGSVYSGTHECAKCHTAHFGGVATCAYGAICDVCGLEYGALSPDSHVGAVYDGTNACSECHTQHGGGVATCVSLAQCGVCYSAYGSVNSFNHAGAPYDGSAECSACHASHTGGRADCMNPAVCGVCGGTYGNADKNNHSGYAAYGYAYCDDCCPGHDYTGGNACGNCGNAGARSPAEEGSDRY